VGWCGWGGGGEGFLAGRRGGFILGYLRCWFFFFFCLMKATKKEVFTKGKRMNYKNKFIERMFYFVMISSTMVMREFLLLLFFFFFW